LIRNTQQQIRSTGIRSLQDVRSCPRRLVTLSPAVEEERRGAKEFLYQNLYYASSLDSEKTDAEQIIRELFSLYTKHPTNLPASYQEKARQEPLPRVVCDYIAGMTDNYIYEQYEKHCGREK
jgi:dGTPase